MGDIRYPLKDGDRTSTGGKIIGTGKMTHHGVQVAVEGDIATCPACKSTGPVYNDCYPAFNLMGKQILVERARVYCKCPENPIGIASQQNFTIEVNRGQRYAPPASPSFLHGTENFSPSEGEEIIEQYYELIDASTGEPASGYRHDLLVDGKRISQNIPLNSGRSAAVRGGLSTSIVLWLDKSQEIRA